jgi:hypothetical protein
MNPLIFLRGGDPQSADGAEEESIRRSTRLFRLCHDVEQAAREADAYGRLEAALFRMRAQSTGCSPGAP